MMLNPFEVPGRVPAPEKRKKPREVIIKASKETENLEARRRELEKEARGFYHEALRLDQELYTEIFQKIHGEDDLSEQVERISLTETLNSGERKARERLSDEDGNLNQVYRERLKGTEEVTAYVKPSHTSTRFDPEGYFHVWNPDTLAFERGTKAGQDVLVLCNIVNAPGYDAERRRVLAQKYGLLESAAILSADIMSARVGVPVERLPQREYAVSHVNELLGWDVVPRTSIRLEADKKDIASVQEAIKSREQSQPARPINYKELSDMWYLPPEKWTSGESDWDVIDDEAPEQGMALKGEFEPHASLTRLACLDYLVGSMDRHLLNVLYDPTTKKCSGIDNGYSFGMATGEKIGIPYFEKPQPAQPEESLLPTVAGSGAIGDPSVYNLRSMPLEIVLRHDLRLTPSDHDALRRTADGLFPQGAALPHVQSLFRFIFGEEKVVAVELQAFQERLAYLVEHGRPPALERNKDFFPITEIMLDRWTQQHVESMKGKQKVA